MAHADVRAQVAAARDSFRAAIEAVSDRWDEPGLELEDDPGKPWANGRTGDAWSPRQVAEHALSSDELMELGLRGRLGEAVGERPEMDADMGRQAAFEPLETAAAALDYLDRRAAVMTELLDSLSDETLATETEAREGLQVYAQAFGYDAGPTLAGSLGMAAAHWADHAQQLRTFAEG